MINCCSLVVLFLSVLGCNPLIKTGFAFDSETGCGLLLQMDWMVCLMVLINI